MGRHRGIHQNIIIQGEQYIHNSVTGYTSVSSLWLVCGCIRRYSYRVSCLCACHRLQHLGLCWRLHGFCFVFPWPRSPHPCSNSPRTPLATSALIQSPAMATPFPEGHHARQLQSVLAPNACREPSYNLRFVLPTSSPRGPGVSILVATLHAHRWPPAP